MTWSKRLTLISALIVSTMASSALAKYVPVPRAPASDPLVLGEWHASLDKGRAYADANETPMVVVWFSTECHYCNIMDDQIASSNFINYRQNRKLVMVLGIDTDKAIKDFTRNKALLYPYVAIYWKGQTWVLSSGRFPSLNPENGQAFINVIESYIGTYVTPPSTPPETDAFDPADNSEGTATRLAMSKVAQASTPHYLNQSDTADWFSFTNLVADTEYRVWISGFTQSGAADLTASFYLGSSATPLTNMPLASLTAAFPYNATGADNLLLKISRSADTNATVAYTLNYHEWVPCTLSFDTNAVSVSEAASRLLVVVRRSGDKAATTATLTFSNGTATAGADYVATPVNVAWTAGGADVKTALVALVNTDVIWEGNETFFIHLTPDPATALEGNMTEQVVTIIEKSAPASGQIGYTAYQTTGNKTPLISSTRIPAHEGDGLALWLARTAGMSLTASSIFTWSDGSPAPAPLSWASGEGGEKEIDVTIPEQPGYQPVRTLYLDFVTTGATRTIGKTRATLLVYDTNYVASLVDYVKLNPAIPFKTTAEAWFQTQGDNATLRCAPPSAAGVSVMSASLTGPGVLAFTGAKSDSGVFTLKVGSRTAQNIVTDGSEQIVVIPAGVQILTWSFARDAFSSNQSFGSIAAPRFVRLPAVAPLAPAAGAIVREGPLTLSWTDAFADVRAIDGVIHEYRVYMGNGAAAPLLLVGGPFGAPEPVTSNIVSASTGTLYWRVDMTLGDGINQVNVKGDVSSTTVVPDAAPTFAVTEGALQDQTWFDGLIDGMTLRVKMTAGVHAAIGPLPTEGGAGTISAKVKTGTLPIGLSLAVENGAVWIKGVPAKAGTGTVLIQVLSKTGKVTTSGTTLAVAYTIAALPGMAYGTFNGAALYQVSTTDKPGVSSMTVASTGKTTGKFQFADKTYVFAADGFDLAEGPADAAIYRITNNVSAFYGTNRIAITIDVDSAWPGIATVHPIVTNQLTKIVSELSHNGWTDRPVDADLQTVMGKCAGYYTAVLPDNNEADDDEFGSSYLAFTVAVNGSVKATGKLADGLTVSMSGTLLLDADGKPYTVLFLAPNTYQGGSFFTRIGFEVPADDSPVALSGHASWSNANPHATGVDGAGFNREIEVYGGFYDTTQTLIDLYSGGTTFDASVSTWAVPVPLGLNVLGTNFTVPTGAVDNPVYLQITANRATGLFSGSFRNYTDASTFTTLSCWGALTPTLSGVAGRGFFLESLQAVGYLYNQSHDFLIAPGL